MENNRKSRDYCADCRHHLYYDGDDFCTHSEHPLQNYSKNNVPVIYDKYQAEYCILFEKWEGY